MTERLRAVFDTNVFVSAFLSANPSSPTQELLKRWQRGELVLLTSQALVEELTQILLERGSAVERVDEFVTRLTAAAE